MAQMVDAYVTISASPRPSPPAFAKRDFFILEGLIVPDLTAEGFEAIGECAAKLSCIDGRFTDFGSSFELDPGPLAEDERERLRIEIDARVAHAWGFTGDDLDVLFRDFSLDAVSAEYRRKLRERLMALP